MVDSAVLLLSLSSLGENLDRASPAFRTTPQTSGVILLINCELSLIRDYNPTLPREETACPL